MKLVSFLLSAWVVLRLEVYASPFQDLNFESPTFVPVGSPYSGSVNPAAALPGWTAYWGAATAPFVLHDNEFLDSAGISILDANFVFGFHPLEGQYTLLLQGGFALSGPPTRVSTSIAQSGDIPVWARSMTVLAQGGNFDVSVNGQSLYNYGGAVDVSAFADQTATIEFTAFPNPPPGLAINNVFLDAIEFSPNPVPEPEAFSLLLVGVVLGAWGVRLFRLACV